MQSVLRRIMPLHQLRAGKHLQGSTAGASTDGGSRAAGPLPLPVFVLPLRRSVRLLASGRSATSMAGSISTAAEVLGRGVQPLAPERLKRNE